MKPDDGLGSDPIPVAPGSLSWPNVHPDFDGHLERPFATWTTVEKIAWLDDLLRLQWEMGRWPPPLRKELPGHM